MLAGGGLAGALGQNVTGAATAAENEALNNALKHVLPGELNEPGTQTDVAKVTESPLPEGAPTPNEEDNEDVVTVGTAPLFSGVAGGSPNAFTSAIDPGTGSNDWSDSATNSTGSLTAAQQLAINQAAGAAFEQTVGAELDQSGLTVGQQITIETESGVRTRLDFLTLDPVTGDVECVECKASSTAPLTKNQTLAFPEIAQSGGTIVGAGKPGFPGGTKIPPTNVQIIRGP